MLGSYVYFTIEEVTYVYKHNVVHFFLIFHCLLFIFFLYGDDIEA